MKAVKEQLRAIPDHGIGFGMLRYLDDATAAVLAPRRLPDISFNYLGRFDTGTPDRGTGTWLPVEDSGLRGVVAPDLPVVFAIDVNAVTLSGPDGPRLAATWDFRGAS